ncbi:MAG: sensor domain-containing diguanylate cyclase [Actinomycetota bacterium]|nr:sensor domain-containing diguanylate cyclase [Actinomycetota bacterium]
MAKPGKAGPGHARPRRQELVAALESWDVAVVASSPDGKITGWNEAAARLYGYQPDEVLGHPITLLVPPDDLKAAEAVLARARDGEDVNDLRARQRCKDGRLALVTLSVSPVVRRGTVGSIVFAARDYSQRQAEKALEASERKRGELQGLVTELHTELGESQARLEGLNAELARLACTDPLTQLRNRLSLGQDLAVLHARASRYGSGYCLAVVDVDHFKAYNDTYGHQAGDEALRMVADTLVATLREADSVYRYGGEEFLVTLPEQDLASGTIAGERARLAVEERRLPYRVGGVEGVVTVSAGVAAWRPGDQAFPEDVLKAADSALYQAKSAGRNRVVGFNG